jgi:hypothetical protein
LAVADMPPRLEEHVACVQGVLKCVPGCGADLRVGVGDPAGEITQGVRAIDDFSGLTGAGVNYIGVHVCDLSIGVSPPISPFSG